MNHAQVLRPALLGLAIPQLQLPQFRVPSVDEMIDKLFPKRAESIDKMFVGFVPDEGETLLGQLALMRTLTDRDADLELGLFTNVSPGETITEATITEPTGTGYARITLTDGSWSEGSAGVYSYAQQTFTAGSGGWTGSIQGYFIATKSAGGTQRIIAIEVDASGPYTLSQDDTYKITPQITYRDSQD